MAFFRRRPAVRTGLDLFLADPPRALRGRRLGFIANPTTVTSDLLHGADALARSKRHRLTALFGPEHGVWADAQDLIEVGDSTDPHTGLPVYSLYGETRVPTEAMLGDVDALVFDVQDVGSRYYTFNYTMLHAMEACASSGRALVVLDRPNPLGGTTVDGNVLDPAYRSFVGMHPLAVRHGMTVGELARMFRAECELKVELFVVGMRGWKRSMFFEDTRLPWVMPSPNVPTVDTAVVYPGGCLIEGTNLSEGRGTTRPFELVGAPWLDPWKLAETLEKAKIRGVRFRPVYFTPTFHKHAGQACGGVQIHVTDRSLFPAFLTYLLLIEAARAQNTKRFAWRDPPYEYELEKLPIDILCGTDAIRRQIEGMRSVRRLAAGWKKDAAGFAKRRRPYLMY